jgi:Ser/Thr protein kinase RdoA (MazF antagonist)
LIITNFKECYFMLTSILQAFGLAKENSTIAVFGSGLINNTWQVTTPEKKFILQRVNQVIFIEPTNISHNIRIIAAYLKQHYPQYLFAAPLVSNNGDDFVYAEGQGFFRMFPFVPDSHSKDVLETPQQAFEAATQFGRFARLLANVDVSQLKNTIPSFHDLILRYNHFLDATKKGNSQRIKEASASIETLIGFSDIVNEYENIVVDQVFKLRVTHHDTKINNVLFDDEGHGLCVIDLDTVMPGYFISDVGDMMRTYLSPVSEEETNFDNITIRDDFYKAVVTGYYNEMKGELTETEKKYFFYAGKFMIYMQALRFLTDYLQDDFYYGAKYNGHNFMRAKNQIVLLQRLLEKEQVFTKIDIDIN